MNNLKCGYRILVMLSVAMICNTTSAVVRVVCTAALLDNQADMRKQEYMRCFNILYEHGYGNPYIVEAIKQSGPTFLDDFSTNVFYSTVNNMRLRNKGVNEGRSLQQAIAHFDFDDNDMIVKLTGRYHLASNLFLRLVESNPHCDAIAKMDPYGQVYTGCFALRYRFLKDFLEHLNFDEMEFRMINIELELANYLEKMIKKREGNVLYVAKLDVDCNIFGAGECVLEHL